MNIVQAHQLLNDIFGLYFVSVNFDKKKKNIVHLLLIKPISFTFILSSGNTTLEATTALIRHCMHNTPNFTVNKHARNNRLMGIALSCQA